MSSGCAVGVWAGGGGVVGCGGVWWGVEVVCSGVWRRVEVCVCVSLSLFFSLLCF